MFLKIKGVTENEKEEIAIVELQGDLECRTQSTLDTEFIGDFYFRKQKDASIPILIIGHHILIGKVQKLDKPLAIMERKQINADNVNFSIKAVVTKKIIFKTRPKPIINNCS